MSILGDHIELPDGTLRCKLHHLEICYVCCVDFTYMRDILREDEEESRALSQGAPQVDEEEEMQDLKRTLCAVCRQPTSRKCSACKDVYYCSNEHQKQNWKDHKKICVVQKATETSKSMPGLLLIAVGGMHQYVDETLNSLFVRMEGKMTISRAVDAGKAQRLLTVPKRPSAIIVGDNLSPGDHPALVDAIVQYAHEGGTVVFGVGFPNFTIPSHIGDIFARLGLPWRNGNYQRVEASLHYEEPPEETKGNTTRSREIEAAPYSTPKKELLERAFDPLPETYYMKALHLKDVSSEHAIYLDVDIGKQEREGKNRVFETPVAFAPVGNGWVGYLGDVNAGHDLNSELVLQAMIGPRPGS